MKVAGDTIKPMPQQYNSSVCLVSVKKTEENFCLIPWITSLVDPLKSMLIYLMWNVCRMTCHPVKVNMGVILLNFSGIVFYLVGKLAHRSVCSPV